MTKKQIQEKIIDSESLKSLAQAFSEISSIKLKKIRGEIERNRLFINDISQVYILVKKAALKKGILSKKTKKVISIVITSNYRFYGRINTNLMKVFLSSTQKYETDRLVIGTTGIEYAKAVNFPVSYKALVLKTDFPNNQELQFLFNEISNYEQVLVYHSQLQSVLVQFPKVVDITQSLPSLANLEHSNQAFIFEPELEKMVNFFEDQITTTALEQTFLESELSRTASRLISMDEAQLNAKKYTKDLKKELGKALNDLKSNDVLEKINTYVNMKRFLAD